MLTVKMTYKNTAKSQLFFFGWNVIECQLTKRLTLQRCKNIKYKYIFTNCSTESSLCNLGFNVITNIISLGQCCCINNKKWDIYKIG